MDTARGIAALAAMIREADRVVVFSGAGISTESGIPDFRSPGGIWSRLQPIQFQDFLASEEMRRESWRRKIEIDRDMQSAQPNRGHRAVAELVRSGKCQHVITQNIDGLHQRSGIPDEKLIELHGNGTYARCLDCGRRHELAPIMDAFRREQRLPHCEDCAGIVKTATISFGQSMPEREMQRTHDAVQQCELFLVLGSSLVVYPAAGFPLLARQQGARLAIVNREATTQDQHAALVIHAGIGPALGEAVGVD